jgi:hypothetical protein
LVLPNAARVTAEVVRGEDVDGVVDSPVSRISQSAASQMRVDHDQERAAHYPVEGLDQVRLAFRLGQRRPPGRSG